MDDIQIIYMECILPLQHSQQLHRWRMLPILCNGVYLMIAALLNSQLVSDDLWNVHSHFCILSNFTGGEYCGYCAMVCTS
jgi:hypothetical protein